MSIVIFNSETSFPLSKSDVELIIKTSAKYEKKIKGGLEVNVVNKKRIKELNRVYRGKNSVTDVLSFAWNEGIKVPGGSAMLGQIYICYSKIKEQAKTFKISVQEECARMLIHGLLHIVGYNHKKKLDAKIMFELQEKIVRISLAKII